MLDVTLSMNGMGDLVISQHMHLIWKKNMD